MAAAALEGKGPLTARRLQDAESYASGEYLADLMRGLQDKAAVERVSGTVADPDRPRPRRWCGAWPAASNRARSSASSAQRRPSGERLRHRGQRLRPRPDRRRSRYEDPVLDAMTAPLTSAMLDHLTRTLN